MLPPAGRGDPVSKKPHLAASDVASPHRKEWARVRWTKLDEESYYRLVGQLRAALAPGEPFWALERYWTVTDEPGV